MSPTDTNPNIASQEDKGEDQKGLQVSISYLDGIGDQVVYQVLCRPKRGEGHTLGIRCHRQQIERMCLGAKLLVTDYRLARSSFGQGFVDDRLGRWGHVLKLSVA